MEVVESIFREYDIGGMFDEDLNDKSVKLIGYFLGKRVAIGFDAGSPAQYLKSGLNESGCAVYDLEFVAIVVNYFTNYQHLNSLIDAVILKSNEFFRFFRGFNIIKSG